MATQVERSETTRKNLMDVARTLFAEKGYSATSIEDIARAASLTKGALYHHFPDKQAMFEAVFEAIAMELGAIGAAGAVGDDAWARFRGGCRAFLEASLDRPVARIAFRDAPAILGWDRFREIESQYSLGLIEIGVKAAIEEGLLTTRAPETLAQLLFGMLCEGARLVASADRPREALDQVLGEVDALLAAFAAAAAPKRRPTRARSASRTS